MVTDLYHCFSQRSCFLTLLFLQVNLFVFVFRRALHEHIGSYKGIFLHTPGKYHLLRKLKILRFRLQKNDFLGSSFVITDIKCKKIGIGSRFRHLDPNGDKFVISPAWRSCDLESQISRSNNIHFDGANVSRFRKYDFETFREMILEVQPGVQPDVQLGVQMAWCN